jgi:hypothetical protein
MVAVMQSYMLYQTNQFVHCSHDAQLTYESFELYADGPTWLLFLLACFVINL